MSLQSDPSASSPHQPLPPWLVLTELTPKRPGETPPSRRRITLWVVASALVVVLLVAVVGVLAARALAETEAINGAVARADLIAEALIEPALNDSMTAASTSGDRAGLGTIDEVVREHVLSSSIVRVKLWAPDGLVIYSDESQLIGQRFVMGEDELEALASVDVRAEVSDLQAPENVYEKNSGKLLETYRLVRTPNGQPLLFEAYFMYDDVADRTEQLWGGFAAITVGSLVLLVVLLLPVLWRLLRQVQKTREQRETALQHALDSSAAERRRIAATLHDGVVQDLAATSFSLAGSAERAASLGDDRLAAALGGASGTVRSTIGSLRSLLVDIYPPSLSTAGLSQAVHDLAASARLRGVTVVVEIAPDLQLDAESDQLVFRVAQECLANVTKHSGAKTAHLRLEVRDALLQLDIGDDGSGFDPAEKIGRPIDGHFGLRVLADTVQQRGAELALRTAPGAGTSWRLRVAQ